MQKIEIIGNIGSDASTNDVNGRKAINFRVACNQRYTDGKGQKQEKTTWYSCTLWRDAGQSTEIARYLNKGTKVFVDGLPSFSLYKTTDGSNQTAVDAKITVRNIELLSSNKENGSQEQGEQNANTTVNTVPGNGESDDLPL